jgi:hypothetical protein
MNQIDIYYNHYHTTPSDINEHFPTLKKYATECNTIYELGVRGIVSTWALLAGHPRKMVSVDITHPSAFGANLDFVYKSCELENIDFKFILGSSLDIDIPYTDLLFIDTIHEYPQLSAELKLHGNKVKKYIIMHDTDSCGEWMINNDGKRWGGMKQAIKEFLKANSKWSIKETFTNNNGLTVLERKEI